MKDKFNLEHTVFLRLSYDYTGVNCTKTAEIKCAFHVISSIYFEGKMQFFYYFFCIHCTQVTLTPLAQLQTVASNDLGLVCAEQQSVKYRLQHILLLGNRSSALANHLQISNSGGSFQNPF